MTPQEYFLSHSLNEEYIKKNFAVTYSEDTIHIPIYGLDKKLLYFKHRHLVGDVKFSFDTGNHPALFCGHKVAKYEWLVLCEGEPDAMRLWQEGIPAVTGTSGVQTMGIKLLEPLKGKEVYICLDTDEAGKSAVSKYCEMLSILGAAPKVLILPQAFKDVSEFFTQGGTKEAFEELMINALSYKEWKKANQPFHFTVEKMTDIIGEKMPPEEWLINNVIPSEGFVFFVGAEATGKSFYTLTIADSIATGKPWLGQFLVKKSTKILFIDKENTRRRTKNRLRGLGITKESGDKMFRIKFPQYFQLEANEQEAKEPGNDGFSGIAHMASELVKEEKIGLIIVDSFADVMIGNENAAGDVQKFFDGFRQLFPGATVLVLHHENKPSQGVVRTASQKMRGSSNIAAQIVCGFRVQAIPKTTNEFFLEQMKAGDAEKMKPFKVKLVAVPDPEDYSITDKKTLVSKIEYGGEYMDEEGKILEAKEIIESLFSDNVTMTRQDLLSNLMTHSNGEISQRSAERAVKQLVENGILEKQRTGREMSYIWVDNDD